MASSSNPKSSSSASNKRKRLAASKPPSPKATRKSIAGKTKKAAGKPDRKAEKAQRSASKTQARDTERALSTRATQTARQGRRVGDIRAEQRAERAKQARKRYRSYLMKIAAVLLGILIVVFGAIMIYRSDLLKVTNVQVTGAVHLTNQEITNIAAVPEGSTLLRLDTEGISERLETNPWVQSVAISRNLPDTITLNITERAPGACVRITKKNIWVVSTDGTWLSAATTDDWKTYKHIVDIDPALDKPVSGSECNDGGIDNAVKVLGGVSDALSEQITSVSAETAAKTSLQLSNGVTVAFGEATDIEEKEAVMWELLDKFKGRISYINVRVPSRPTYRTLDNGESSQSE